MTWTFEEMDDFEFHVFGYASRLNGKYTVKGVLKQIVRSNKDLRRLTLDTAVTALGEEGNIFDLSTEVGREYFIAVTDGAAYVVLGNSQFYNYACCGEIPILRIDGIDSEKDVITLSEVDNKKSTMVIERICDLVKRSARDVYNLQKNVMLKIKKEDGAMPSMPWQ